VCCCCGCWELLFRGRGTGSSLCEYTSLLKNALSLELLISMHFHYISFH